MPDTKAMIGYGSTFEMADLATPNDFFYVAEAYNLTPPSDTTDTVDATHMQSPNKTREFIDGLTDPGEASFEMNLVPGSTSDQKVQAAKGKRKWCRITFPNGVQLLFVGIRQGYERAAPTDDKMTATVTWKVSGEPILTDPTAPRAIVDPVLSGVALAGVPLTLDPGIWAGALEFGVQWEVDDDGSGVTWSDIVGATGRAYVPQPADVGKLIRVKVTGENDTFTSEVISAPTGAVAA